MSKGGSETLYQLIQSLSKAEKRYISVFIHKQSIHEGGIYNRLFDAVNSQKIYNENKLRSFPHLAVMKIRLEESILSGLHSFHSEKSIAEKLKREIRFVELLFHKGLLAHTLKRIGKAKKIAEHYNEYLSLFELLKWELKIINKQAFASVSEAEMKKIYHSADDCLARVLNANRYSLLSDSVYMQIRKHGILRNKSELLKFRSLMKHPLLKDENKADSVDAQYFFHSAHIGYANLKGDFRKASEHNNKILKILESHPQLIQKEPRQYLVMQQNTSVWLVHLKEYQKVLVVLENLKTFLIQQRSTFSEALFSRTFYYVNSIILYSYCRLGEYDKGIRAIPVFKNEFLKYKISPSTIEEEWIFMDTIATTHFGLGNFSEASRCMNAIIQNKATDVRMDMQCTVRIFSLIVHFELGNQELLRYMVKWTYRFLAKHNRLYKFENIILDFIRKKSQHMNTRKEQTDAFKGLKTEFEKLLPDIHERRPLDDFEYIEWLESKIENKPFSEIVQKKHKDKTAAQN